MSELEPGALDAGVPPGTVETAVGFAARVAVAAGRLAGEEPTGVDVSVVAAHVLLPAVVAARDRSDWARPAPPRPAPGSGVLAADLGAPGDEETFARLLTTLPGDASALVVEQAAQEWRLPVVAYRPRPGAGPRRRAGAVRVVAGGERARAARPLTGRRVVDLTSMWAGPLATWLLACLGAEVVKVEGEVRPDGMRGQPAVFEALDEGKLHVQLDLRDDASMAELRGLLATADVVVDSFSPRVMPNLGLDRPSLRALNPAVVAVSIPAFSASSAEAGWVAYGTGVHARAGLGDLGDSTFAAPAVTYPDPLGGLHACAVVVESLAQGVAGRSASLAEAVEPLLAFGEPDPAGRRLCHPVEPVAAWLADDLTRRDRWRGPGTASPFGAPR